MTARPCALHDAAVAVADAVAPRAEEIERGRRLPLDVVDQIVDSGLFKACVPSAYGGAAAEPVSLLDAFETVARADGSSGWCVMIGATSGIVCGWLEPDAAEEICAPPTTVMGGVLAPRGSAVPLDGGDGARVDGRWPFGSGCEHCTWLIGRCIGPDGVPLTALFPAEAVVIHDTWTVSGLRGTGSHDFEVRGLAVPDRHLVHLGGPPTDDSALYRMPIFGLLATGIAAVALGIAGAALDCFSDLARAKTATGHRAPLAERPALQAELARATASLASAKAYLYDSVGSVWERAEQGDTVDVGARVTLRLAATHATRTAADVATTAYTLGGGTSVYADHPLQRQFRDVHVATQHMMVGPATWDLAGRVLLGGPDTAEL